MSNTHSQRTVPELEGAQCRIRDEVIGHNSGLFCLDCNPGAGKSTVAEQIVAHVLGRKFTAGEQSPADSCCFVSFARDDAATLAPGVCAAIPVVAERDDAIDLSDDEIETLQANVRQAPRIGTIDSVLREIFGRCHSELGFDAMPTVGNQLSLQRVQENVTATVSERHAEEHAQLAEQYGPLVADTDESDEQGLDKLLVSAHQEMRQRCLSVDGFERSLRDIHQNAYPEGRPETPTDILMDARSFTGDETLDSTDLDHTDAQLQALLRADQTCHDQWNEAINQFTTLLESFDEVYDRETKARGVLGHSDIAHWVRRYFIDDVYDSPFRQRLSQRYDERFQFVVIDEAQDVSAVQHGALAQLVPEDARVLCVADIKQTVYDWRTARPDLFKRAVETGEYLGRTWDIHKSETAAVTFRLRPGIADAVNEVFTPVFEDPVRGGGGRLDIDFNRLESKRESRTAPSVHVTGCKRPAIGTEGAKQQANRVAAHVAGGLCDGTLGEEETTVTVLFRSTGPMEIYADAFEEKNLTVARGGRPLFESPHVQFACGVVSWLCDPTAQAHTTTFVANELVPRLSTADDSDVRNISDVLHGAITSGDTEFGKLPTECSDIVERLADLGTRSAKHTAATAAEIIVEVVDTLALPSLSLETQTNVAQRVANADALVETVADLENGDRIPIEECRNLLTDLRSNADDGPQQPVVESEDYDVIFKTIHGMKGDQDDVIVLADIDGRVGYRGPWQETFIARGQTIALSPPGTFDGEPLPGYDHGVFSRGAADSAIANGDQTRRGSGLRWATDRLDNSESSFVGPPRLSEITADQRAEEWRLLFVAMTRAKEHLILPLPEYSVFPPADSWSATLREALSYDETVGHDNYTISVSTGTETTVSVGVNDVDFVEGVPKSGTSPPQAATPPSSGKTNWTPKHVNGSSMYPLFSDPKHNFLAHIQSTALDDGHATANSPIAPLDVVSPDTLGDIVHGVISCLLSTSLSPKDVRQQTDAAEQTFGSIIGDHTTGLKDKSRADIITYLCTEICPQFIETTTWQRLQASDPILVEEPLHTVLAAGERGIAIESQNQADIISQSPNGTWFVDEIKLSLTEIDEHTQKRHQLQTAFYEWILNEQETTVSTDAQITYLGVDQQVTAVSPPLSPIRDWIDRLSPLLDEN